MSDSLAIAPERVPADVAELGPYLTMKPGPRRFGRVLVEAGCRGAQHRRDYVRGDLFWWEPGMLGELVPEETRADGNWRDATIALELASAVGSDFGNDEMLRLLAVLLALVGPGDPAAREAFEAVVGGEQPDAERLLVALKKIEAEGAVETLRMVLEMKLVEDGTVCHLELRPTADGTDAPVYVWTRPLDPRLRAEFTFKVGKALGYEEVAS